MGLGWAIVDASTDRAGAPIRWAALPPMLYRLADGSDHVILPAGAEAVDVLCVVSGRGGPNWYQLTDNAHRAGQVQYED